MDSRKVIYRKQADRIIKGLNKRNMTGFYVEDPAEAVAKICQMISPNSLVGLGGSETVIETGLIDALRNMDIQLLDRYRKGVSGEEIEVMRERGLTSDYFITSTNAITLDGILVNMDGQGNRVACLIFGPKKVIVITGMNKVTVDVKEAVSRIKREAAPTNAIRRKASTPCSETGVCRDSACFPPGRICNQLVITEGSRISGRITVVLIGSTYGF